MKGRRVNRPFVALSAFLVGMLVTGLVVAVDPLPGPPVKQVATYVVRGPDVPFPSPDTALLTVRVECNVGDSVVGGGYEISDPGSFSFLRRSDFANLLVTSSHNFVNVGTGAQGWEVSATLFLGSDLPLPSIRAVATCLHVA